jgi:hypothetical protein
MKRNRMLYLYLGHHKCASLVLSRIFQEIMVSMGKKYGCITYPLVKIEKCVAEHHFEALAFLEADYSLLKNLENFKAFHLIRDPRDIAISAYFSHHYSHPTGGWDELEEHRRRLCSVSQEEGLFLDMEFEVTKGTFTAMQRWEYNNANILELKFEQFSIDPVRTFLDVFSFFSLLEETGKREKFLDFIINYNKTINLFRALRPLKKHISKIPTKALQRIVEKYSFEKMSGGRQ